MDKGASGILSRLSLREVFEIIGLTIVFILLTLVSLIEDLSIFGYSVFDFRIIHVVIALIPLLILLVVIGDLEEIRGPMGVSLSIRSEANRSINPVPHNARVDFISGPTLQKGSLEKNSVQRNPDSEAFENQSPMGSTVDERDPAGFDESISEILDIDIDENQLNQEQRTELTNYALIYQAIEESAAVVLSFEIGYPNYDISAISDYMEIILRHSSVHHILFINNTHQFECLMNVTDFNDYCSSLWTNPVDDIESGDILEDSRVITESVHLEATNKVALEKMNKADKNLLAVVDNGEEFRGFISQEQITREVLTTLFSDA